MKPSSWLLFGSTSIVSTPLIADEGTTESSQLLLSIAIVLGIVASGCVFVLSNRMGGGGIATAPFLYGLGMPSVVTSLLSVTWLKDILPMLAGTAHDVFFIIGFVLMMSGSHKVSRLFRSR